MPSHSRHTTKQIKSWQRNVNNRLPLIGGWIRHKAAQTLIGLIQEDQDSEATRILAEALSKTTDDTLIDKAEMVFSSPLSQSCLDEIWGVWAKSRNPNLHNILRKQPQTASKPDDVKVLSILFLGSFEQIQNGKPSIIAPLIETCRDPDLQIAERARYAIGLLKNQETINALCSIWANTRDPDLERTILQYGYSATQPDEVFILTVLLHGKPDRLQGLGPDQIDILVRFCHDSHPSINKHAVKALSQLKNQLSRDEVCKRVIQLNDPISLTAAVHGNYLPSTPEMRAVFLFLTDRWEEYNALDFDQSLMRLVYVSASVDLRQRIVHQVQNSGRVEYLTIFAGEDYCSRVGYLNENEIEPLIHLLIEEKEWNHIWNLVQGLPLKWSIRCLHYLVENAWQPVNENERLLFIELVKYIPLDMNFDRNNISQLLPSGISRARIKVSGRINDIAFSPIDSVLAIATGRRKVVLWDYQHGSIQRILDGYNHSVGKVNFSPDGSLLSAERTNGNEPCDVYCWKDGQGFWVGSHTGSITALIVLKNDQAISTGHDQKIYIWDLNQHQLYQQKECSFWSRNACTNSDGTLLALLHDGINLMRIPSLENLKIDQSNSRQSTRINGKGIVLSAVFDNAGQNLFIGKYNGQVHAYPVGEQATHRKTTTLQTHTGQVRGLVYHSRHSLVISGGSEGTINLTRWPSNEAIKQLLTDGEKLTSLQLSSDGSFLAVGNTDTTVTLWDLRVLDIPDMVGLPIAQFVPNSLGVIEYLSDDDHIPMPIRNSLRYLLTILKFRFRYDIQVDELQLIQPGEYDILLEDLSS